ncbi:DUF6588 family protein [Gramella sp. AN32]|uniref:DUF6588 family protein n=1 Tax=Christiangramia antarctica TaxID=2058158 RepID=A0ABW5XB42_9FLAO|nr:DUF6588 family protein [Gramella sp. AN32]MCM4155867.1 hypothetical protein [Gramella sp. AN32]
MKRYLYLCVIGILLIPNVTSSQEQTDVDLFIEDMLFLGGSFARPAASSAAYQASAGWFSSATPLEKWKFNVSLQGNALFVPQSKKEFAAGNNNFKILSIMGGERNVLLPTAFGKSTDVQFEGTINYLGQTIEITEFDAIDGIDKGALIYPFAQVSMGLPLGTELAVRALPELAVDGSKFSTYGVGLKHNLTQYFQLKRRRDMFQLALAGSYNLFDVKYEFEQIAVPEVVTLNLIDVHADVWMAEVLASKKYENFEIFGALGVTGSKFDYAFGGTGFGLPLINNAIVALEDSETQFKGDVGFNLYFTNFKVSTMVTAGNFFNLNLGLHFRI